MTLATVIVAPRARRDLAALYDYLNAYSVELAEYHVTRLENQIEGLADPLVTWSFFSITGAPYRAKLFSVGRRTKFWIVYRERPDLNEVHVLRIWNASRDLEDFSI